MIKKLISLDESQEKFLLENFKNVTQGVQECIQKSMFPCNELEILKHIRAYSRKELKGIFTKEEWMFFIDSLNGTLADGMFRCNAGALMYHCQDAAELEGTADKWHVNMQQLLGKTNKLTGAQVDALYTFVEEFWENPKDLEEYSSRLV